LRLLLRFPTGLGRFLLWGGHAAPAGASAFLDEQVGRYQSTGITDDAGELPLPVQPDVKCHHHPLREVPPRRHIARERCHRRNELCLRLLLPLTISRSRIVPVPENVTKILSNPLVSPEAQYVGSPEGVRYYRFVSLTRPAMPTKPVRGNRGSNRKHLPTEATRGLVKGCVACGASQESICSLLGGIALPHYISIIAKSWILQWSWPTLP
jgi:hypothetical protein